MEIEKYGTVTKSTGSWYMVTDNKNNIFQCRIKGKFRIKDINSTNPIAVGDNVFFDVDSDGLGIIKKIEDRKNYIIRKSVNLSKKIHIIAANIDQAFLFVTLAHPETTFAFIDRFLVTAHAYQISVVLLFNKIDIYEDESIAAVEQMIDIYEKIGYHCIKLSSTENINIDVASKLLINKITLLSGHSGTGKSSFVKAVDATIDIKIATISSATFKGMHTTTYSEMYNLNGNSKIIDTPGIKGFGIVDFKKEELAHHFPEMFKVLPNCKFHNCTHISEPGCAVKQAVESNEISAERYDSYLKIYNNADEVNYR
jgi:ribosome biogenesis GTPase / thiamine phosphate phosphatase